jgi:hypothetical protein
MLFKIAILLLDSFTQRPRQRGSLFFIACKIGQVFGSQYSAGIPQPSQGFSAGAQLHQTVILSCRLCWQDRQSCSGMYASSFSHHAQTRLRIGCTGSTGAGIFSALIVNLLTSPCILFHYRQQRRIEPTVVLPAPAIPRLFNHNPAP